MKESFSDTLAGVALGDELPDRLASDEDGKYFVTTVEGMQGRAYLAECRGKVQDIRFMATYSSVEVPGFDVSVVTSPVDGSAAYFARLSETLDREGWEKLEKRSGRDENGDFAEYYRSRRKRGLSRQCQSSSELDICIVTMTTISRVECR